MKDYFKKIGKQSAMFAAVLIGGLLINVVFRLVVTLING